MDIIQLYNIYIYERYKDLKNSGKNEFDNNDLWKIFEWYSAIILYKETNKLFYEYNDILPEFKEQNKMSKNDTGIDLCNLEDTIVQCKLRNKSLSWTDCATFFGGQNMFDETLQKTIIRWQKLIITRNSDCKLSENLLERSSLFTDKPFDKTTLLNFCENLYNNPPKYPVQIQNNFELRYYQIECIDLIKTTNQNVSICIPTGTGKNIIIIHSIELNKKYLILVPRIILMEQLKDELLSHRPEFKSKIQLIGDSNNSFKEHINITICIFNSIHLVEDYKYDKVFVDESHHIYNPEIYNIQQEENYYDEENDNLLFIEDSDDEPEVDNKKEIDDKIKESYIDKIIKLQKYNNNVYLSATIDTIDNFINYKKDIRDMIEEGYLTDYDIHIPIFSDDPTDKTVCLHLLQHYKNIIVYCDNRNKGQYINKLLNKLQQDSSEYIDCNTSKKERKKIIKKYKEGEISFLVNVRVLVEGFDAPITKGVCFIHLPSSSTTVIQIIGRALRKHPSKIIAHVILPFSDNDDEKGINAFLKTIARNDKKIRKTYESKIIGGYINLYNTTEVEEDENVILKYNMIFDKMGVCKNSNEIWEDILQEVKNYIDKYNKRPRQHTNNIKERYLGVWLSAQIQKYKKNIIQGTRKTLWEDFQDKYIEHIIDKYNKWIYRLRQIKLYIKNYKKQPSNKAIQLNQKKLGIWLVNQKRSYCKNKLEEYRKSLWEKFINKYNKYIMSKDERWNYMLLQIECYVITNKRFPKRVSNPSTKLELTERKLGDWLDSQKRVYNKDKMSEKRKKIWQKFITNYS